MANDKTKTLPEILRELADWLEKYQQWYDGQPEVSAADDSGGNPPSPPPPPPKPQ